MNNVAVRVENLSKRYAIGDLIRTQDLLPQVARSLRRIFHIARTGDGSGSHGRYIWALKHISFQIERGEVLGIIGLNGAGKSTLLKILSRITAPTEGLAHIYGRVGSLLEVGTGFHSELSGRENIYLNGSILGMKKAEIDCKFDEIVDFSGVENFIDTPVKRYSSGMRVRLGFAVAAHLEPEILICDEVLAVGDVEFQKKCLGAMGKMAKSGRTVFFVSHNMAAVTTLCHNALLLKDGYAVQKGPADSVVKNYLQSTNILAQDPQRIIQDDIKKEVQITRVWIRDHRGIPTTCHELTHPINVEVDFVVRRSCPNLVASCQVRSRLDEILLVTTEADWLNHAAGKRSGTFPKEAGRYRASFNLPSPFLNVDDYRLALILLEPRKTIYDSAEDIPLTIVDSGSFSSCLFFGRRRGYVTTPIRWEVSHLS